MNVDINGMMADFIAGEPKYGEENCAMEKNVQQPQWNPNVGYMGPGGNMPLANGPQNQKNNLKIVLIVCVTIVILAILAVVLVKILLDSKSDSGKNPGSPSKLESVASDGVEDGDSGKPKPGDSDLDASEEDGSDLEGMSDSDLEKMMEGFVRILYVDPKDSKDSQDYLKQHYPTEAADVIYAGLDPGFQDDVPSYAINEKKTVKAAELKDYDAAVNKMLDNVDVSAGLLVEVEDKEDSSVCTILILTCEGKTGIWGISMWHDANDRDSEVNYLWDDLMDKVYR